MPQPPQTPEQDPISTTTTQPILPLDIIREIAALLATQHALGTLAALNVTCVVIH